jgi:hypothetical protein
MTDTSSPVAALWDAFERRAWAEARALFHDDAVLSWPVSGERIEGADGIIRVNAIYPEGWSIHPLRIRGLPGASAYSIVRVNHPPDSFFAVSFFDLRDGRIAAVEEYWSTVEEPPGWRTPEAIPGYVRQRG